MFPRYVAFSLVLVFAALVSAAGVTCLADDRVDVCCCAPSDSVATLPSSDSCCAIQCGSPAPDLPVPPVDGTTSSVLSFDLPGDPIGTGAVGELFSELLPVSLKAVAFSVAHQDPPDVYLQKATFLI